MIRAIWAAGSISIHAPRGGSDIIKRLFELIVRIFQSTLPVGGATRSVYVGVSWHIYFNPRSPWGERPKIGKNGVVEVQISIHAPRGGSDRRLTTSRPRCPIFQSTLPVEGATAAFTTFATRHGNFNPRSPWRERPVPCLCSPFPVSFQSTLPVEGATREDNHSCQRHAKFQSTLPVEGATSAFLIPIPGRRISIHAPRGGSDDFYNPVFANLGISIHAPRGGSDSRAKKTR